MTGRSPAAAAPPCEAMVTINITIQAFIALTFWRGPAVGRVQPSGFVAVPLDPETFGHLLCAAKPHETASETILRLAAREAPMKGPTQ
jgi:hypothetical protein